MSIISFPAIPEHERMRARIADQLAEIAEHIRRGEVEVEADPDGWMLVLKSASGFEVLHVNFSTSQRIQSLESIRRSTR